MTRFVRIYSTVMSAVAVTGCGAPRTLQVTVNYKGIQSTRMAKKR